MNSEFQSGMLEELLWTRTKLGQGNLRQSGSFTWMETASPPQPVPLTVIRDPTLKPLTDVRAILYLPNRTVRSLPGIVAGRTTLYHHEQEPFYQAMKGRHPRATGDKIGEVFGTRPGLGVALVRLISAASAGFTNECYFQAELPRALLEGDQNEQGTWGEVDGMSSGGVDGFYSCSMEPSV
ncbi:hypothetical protein P168DRAFT_284826 [Aspergillus campestris IBT 28561]|uniref:Uncharacterized protein n=1 Tax=Aspergillus campestris (strain IBT 28561) TaxID=1392248 RepID=A0A2I1CUK6_ASPC2|nr:uncharacterized protein P168DRAFT_284826 [Aspergillus campestris IBT 28561]PKY01308.1 hypothetical protein P168DRAFT_284826 [Aspergillus campestris IBT 28561]